MITDPMLLNLIRFQFIPQVNLFATLGRERVLGAFALIDQDAEAESRRRWNDALSQPGTGDTDLSHEAERAEEAGRELFNALTALKQTAMNLLVVGLYHLFEQQRVIADDRLREVGQSIPWEELSSWPKVNELRLAANAIKHAEGTSAEQLRRLRRDLFIPPELRGIGADLPLLRADQPLAGRSIYMTESDITQYGQSLEAAWREAAEALQSRWAHQPSS